MTQIVRELGIGIPGARVRRMVRRISRGAGGGAAAGGGRRVGVGVSDGDDLNRVNYVSFAKLLQRIEEVRACRANDVDNASLSFKSLCSAHRFGFGTTGLCTCHGPKPCADRIQGGRRTRPNDVYSALGATRVLLRVAPTSTSGHSSAAAARGSTPSAPPPA